ncbi:hypothetical protein [Xanthomonas campestris]|uniref:hypothetical protein n=1 Tax=Xanthomonas campestris TaxID=339 RepID=UPI003CCF180B
MFITQWPDKIDSELFRLVGTHWHLNRAFGLQSASLCAFTRGVMNPYSATARKGADESIWSYPRICTTSTSRRRCTPTRTSSSCRPRSATR